MSVYFTALSGFCPRCFLCSLPQPVLLQQLEMVFLVVYVWVGSTGTSNHRFLSLCLGNKNKCCANSFDLLRRQHYSLLEEQGFARNEKRLTMQMSLLKMQEHEQISQMKWQWVLAAAGPWTGIEWTKSSLPFTSPHCPNPALHCYTRALPTCLVCSTEFWLTNSTAELTDWHHLISAWHNRTSLGDSFIMPQIGINRNSKQM